jgi:hypothetical protein
MKKRLLVAAAAAMIVAVVVVPLAASGGQDQRVTIGVRLDFTSATHADGSFAACCAITDSGTASADVTSFVPQGNEARFEATNTFVGSKGSFTLELRGTTGPLGSPVHVADARWRVIGGTGEYEDLEGRGRLKAVTDQNTGALTAIDTGQVWGDEDEDEDEDDD